MPSDSHSGANRTSAADRREAIIDIAAAQFARTGYHGVSMRDIAKVHGSSVASLYNHFPSKDALLLAVGARYYDSFIQRLEAAATADGDNRHRLVEMVRVSMQQGMRYRDEYVSLSRDRYHIRKSPGLEPLVAAVEHCLELWYQVMRAGQADGSVRPDLDPATTIWAALIAVSGLIDTNSMTAIAGSPPTSPVSTLCTIFSEGLRPVDPSRT